MSLLTYNPPRLLVAFRMKSKLLNILLKLLLPMHFLQVLARPCFFQKVFADHRPLESGIRGTALGSHMPMLLSTVKCIMTYNIVISLALHPIDCQLLISYASLSLN